VILNPRITVAEIHDVVDDGRMTRRLPIRDVGIGCRQRDVALGLERNAVVPGIEPDQCLSLRLRPVGAGMHDDSLVVGILGCRFEGVLDVAAWMNMLSVARGPRSAPRLCSGRPRECVDRQSSKRGEQLKNRAAIGNWRLHREDQGYHPALRRAIRTRTPDDRTAACRHRLAGDC
jgi:hypothetical protein